MNPGSSSESDGPPAAQFIEGKPVGNERGRLDSRSIGPEDLLPNRIRDEKDVTNPVPVVELDREEGREDGQGRPLRVVQRPAVPQRALDPAGLSEDRRVGRHDRRAGHGIRPEVGHLRVVDDQQVRAILPDEIRPSPLEGSLEFEVVRHDAAAVGEGHRLVAGLVRRGLAAQDRHLVTGRDSREQLPQVRPDPAPDPPEFWSRHRDLRWLVPPVLG